MEKLAISQKLISKALKARQIRTLAAIKIGKFRGLEGEALEEFVANRKKLKLTDILKQPISYLRTGKKGLSRGWNKNLSTAVAKAQKDRGMNKANDATKYGATDNSNQLNRLRMLLNREATVAGKGIKEMTLLPNIKKRIKLKREIDKSKKALIATGISEEAAMKQLAPKQKELDAMSNDLVTMKKPVDNTATMDLGNTGFEAQMSVRGIGGKEGQVEVPANWDVLARKGEGTSDNLPMQELKRHFAEGNEEARLAVWKKLIKTKYKDIPVEELANKVSPEQLWKDYQQVMPKRKGIEGIDINKRLKDMTDSLGTTSGITTSPGNETAASIYHRMGFQRVRSGVGNRGNIMISQKKEKDPLIRALVRKFMKTSLPSDIAAKRERINVLGALGESKNGHAIAASRAGRREASEALANRIENSEAEIAEFILKNPEYGDKLSKLEDISNIGNDVLSIENRHRPYRQNLATQSEIDGGFASYSDFYEPYFQRVTAPRVGDDGKIIYQTDEAGNLMKYPEYETPLLENNVNGESELYSKLKEHF